MLSQLAQWQQSRKVFFLLALRQQWQEKFQRSLFRGLFKNLAVFQVMNTLGQTGPSGRRPRTAGDAPAEFTRWGLPSPVCPRPSSSPHQAPCGGAPQGPLHGPGCRPVHGAGETRLGCWALLPAPLGFPGALSRQSRRSALAALPHLMGFSPVLLLLHVPALLQRWTSCCCGNLPACSGGAVPRDPQPVKPEVCSHGVTVPHPHRHLPPPFSAEDNPGFVQTPFLQQRMEGEG